MNLNRAAKNASRERVDFEVVDQHARRSANAAPPKVSMNLFEVQKSVADSAIPIGSHSHPERTEIAEATGSHGGTETRRNRRRQRDRGSTGVATRRAQMDRTVKMNTPDPTCVLIFAVRSVGASRPAWPADPSNAVFVRLRAFVSPCETVCSAIFVPSITRAVDPIPSLPETPARATAAGCAFRRAPHRARRASGQSTAASRRSPLAASRHHRSR